MKRTIPEHSSKNILHGRFQTDIDEVTLPDGTKKVQTEGLLYQQEMNQVCDFLSKRNINPFTNRSIAIGSRTFWKVVKLCEDRSVNYQAEVRQTLGELELQLKDLGKAEIAQRKQAYIDLFQPDQSDKKLSAKERKNKYQNVFSHFGEKLSRIDRGVNGFIPLLPADELVIRSKIQETLARLQQHIELIEPYFDDLCRTIFTVKKYNLDYSSFKVDEKHWESKEPETIKAKKMVSIKSGKEVHSTWRTEQKLYFFALKIIQKWSQQSGKFPAPTASNQVRLDFERKLEDGIRNPLVNGAHKFILDDGSYILIPKFELTKPLLDQVKNDFESFGSRYQEAFGDTARIDGASVCKWKGTKSNRGMLQILLADDPDLLTLLLQYNQMLKIIKNIKMIAKGKGNEKRLSQIFDNINLELKNFASFFDALFKRLINDTKYLDLKNKWPQVLPSSHRQILSDSLSPDKESVAYSKINEI